MDNDEITAARSSDWFFRRAPPPPVGRTLASVLGFAGSDEATVPLPKRILVHTGMSGFGGGEGCTNEFHLAGGAYQGQARAEVGGLRVFRPYSGAETLAEAELLPTAVVRSLTHALGSVRVAWEAAKSEYEKLQEKSRSGILRDGQDPNHLVEFEFETGVLSLRSRARDMTGWRVCFSGENWPVEDAPAAGVYAILCRYMDDGMYRELKKQQIEAVRAAWRRHQEERAARGTDRD